MIFYIRKHLALVPDKIHTENDRRTPKKVLTLEQVVVSGSITLLIKNSITMTFKIFFLITAFFKNPSALRGFLLDKATFLLQNLQIILFKATFPE